MAEEQKQQQPPSLHIDTDWKKQAQEEKRRLSEEEQKRAADRERSAAPPAPSAPAGIPGGPASGLGASASATAERPARGRAGSPGSRGGEHAMPEASFP